MRSGFGDAIGGCACVDEHGGAVGKDEEGGVAAAGGDLVDVESAGRPGRECLGVQRGHGENGKGKCAGRVRGHELRPRGVV